MELVQSLEERPAAGTPAGFMEVARQAFTVAHSAASQGSMGHTSARSLPPRPSLDAPSRSLQPPRASPDAPGRAHAAAPPAPGEGAFAQGAQVRRSPACRSARAPSARAPGRASPARAAPRTPRAAPWPPPSHGARCGRAPTRSRAPFLLPRPC